MKKIYTLVAGLVLAGSVNAQTIDLTGHTAGAFGGVASSKYPATNIFSFQSGGLVSGTADIQTAHTYAVAQLFDETDGVVAGKINSASFLLGKKVGTASQIIITVSEADNYDYQGTTYYTPGATIASQTVALSTIDTAQASVNLIGGSMATATGLYNNKFTFSNANIPANKKFFVTISVPLGTSGDTLGVFTTFSSQDVGGVANFPTSLFDYAYTGDHSGVVLGTDPSTADFYSYGEILNPAPTFANYISANISAEGVGTLDLASNEVKVYPNPAQDMLNVEVAGVEISSVNIYSLDGKKVVTNNVSNVSTTKVDVSSLTVGTYIYEIVSSNGATFKSKFVKK